MSGISERLKRWVNKRPVLNACARRTLRVAVDMRFALFMKRRFGSSYRPKPPRASPPKDLYFKVGASTPVEFERTLSAQRTSLTFLGDRSVDLVYCGWHAYQTRSEVIRSFGGTFAIREYVDLGQDVLVLQKDSRRLVNCQAKIPHVSEAIQGLSIAKKKRKSPQRRLHAACPIFSPGSTRTHWRGAVARRRSSRRRQRK